VLATDAETNTVTVGSRAELARRSVEVEAPTLHRPAERIDSVKLRYRSASLPCSARERKGGGLALELDRETSRPAPGQTAVFFADGLVVGHGTIA
jgi:tRNA U34 2-thiouridine synthase MnmA/TrmU